MATRGAAPAAPCPRCGAIAPPTGERLVTCAACKLAFDPAAERSTSIRRNRGAALIERIRVTRAPAQLTVTSAFERRKGLALAASGIAIVAASIMNGLSVLGIAGGVVGMLIAILGIPFIAPHVIRVDRELISAGRLLLGRKALLLSDLAKVETGAVLGVEDGAPIYYVTAVSASGPNTLLFVTRSRELADHVTRIVGDAVATMPATSSPTDTA